MKDKITNKLIFSVTLLIIGNLVGAGILALPTNVGIGGFIPAIVGMILMAGAMYYTSTILSKEASLNKKLTFNYPSLYHKYLGNFGKWVAILANLLILYGLLTAYLTGATSIIVHLFKIPIPNFVVLLIFFSIITFLNIKDIIIIRKYNVVLMVLMWVSFALIVIMSEKHVQIQRLSFQDWGFLPSTIPIIVTAACFHVIIPQISKDLKWNTKIINRVMLFGLIVGMLMNIIWIQAGIGAIPLDSGNVNLLNAFENNLPVTVPLTEVVNSSIFIIFSLLFAILAIATSYLATGTSLLGFIEDLTKNHFKKSYRWLDIIIAFVPPLLVSIFYPGIFLKALNIVGGVGVVLLFGILPSIMALRMAKSKKKRIFATVVLIIFISILVLELGQEFGLLKIHPEVEYWNHNIAVGNGG